jgi:hypothetical protein
MKTFWKSTLTPNLWARSICSGPNQARVDENEATFPYGPLLVCRLEGVEHLVDAEITYDVHATRQP